MLGCPLSGLAQHPEHGASGVLLLRLLPLTSQNATPRFCKTPLIRALEWLGFCMGKTQSLRRFPGPWCTPWQVPGPAWEFGQFGGARADGISAAGTIYKRN